MPYAAQNLKKRKLHYKKKWQLHTKKGESQASQGMKKSTTQDLAKKKLTTQDQINKKLDDSSTSEKRMATQG